MDRENTFYLPAGNIPEQTSSRSQKKGKVSRSKRLRQLEDERNACNDEAKKKREKLKNLKPESSFDAAYWTARRDIAEKEIQATLLTKQVSIASMKGRTEDNTKAFVESEFGQTLLLQEESLKLDSRVYQAQAEKMGCKEENLHLHRSFMQLFIAQTGLGIKNTRGKRDSSLQSEFRSELKRKMGHQHPTRNRAYEYLCPVTNAYWIDSIMVAGHLFPWKCGEAAMHAIFGCPDKGDSELFKAENGIFWSLEAETRFEAGHFVIVPDTPDQPTKQQVDTWQASDPREYKVRVLNPTHTLMEQKIPGTDKTWVELDNQRLQFKTNFRPRARYLYFAYCAAMLRRSFGGHHLEVSRSELGKRFWGTPGRYMLE